MWPNNQYLARIKRLRERTSKDKWKGFPDENCKKVLDTTWDKTLAFIDKTLNEPVEVWECPFVSCGYDGNIWLCWQIKLTGDQINIEFLEDGRIFWDMEIDRVFTEGSGEESALQAVEFLARKYEQNPQRNRLVQ